MSWRITEHTADVGIEAEADSEAAALEDAAQALVAIITGQDELHRARPDEEVRFRIEAPDKPALLVAFLSEILWILESKGILWIGGGVEVGVQDDGEHYAEGRGNGVRFDPAKHGHGVEVKAVTYHQLRFERDGQGLVRVRVLLDI